MPKGRSLRDLGTKNAAVPEDAGDAQLYWAGLSVDEKLGVMRFEDAPLVKAVFFVQQRLCRADMQCFNKGIRGQDAVRSKVGMSQFSMECDEEGIRPTSFFARDTFVERDDLVKYIEGETGQPFLAGCAAVEQEDWHLLFERPKPPNSWQDFMRQVLRLTGLAILASYRRSLVAPESSAPCGVEENDGKKSNSKNAKRKERKKRQLSFATQTTGDEAEYKSDGEEDQVEDAEYKSGRDYDSEATMECKSFIDESEATSIYGAESLGSAPVHIRAGVNGSSVQDDDTVSVSTNDTANFATIPRAEGFETTLYVDWCDAEPPLETVLEADVDVELQVDWSGAVRPGETRWAAWAGNGLTGVRAEWHWVDTSRPLLTSAAMRAHMKNTFLEVVEDDREPDLRRTKSVPVMRRLVRHVL